MAEGGGRTAKNERTAGGKILERERSASKTVRPAIALMLPDMGESPGKISVKYDRLEK
jgi:hypothetical protein